MGPCIYVQPDLDHDPLVDASCLVEMTGAYHCPQFLLIEMDFLPKVTSNHDSPNLCLLKNWITGISHVQQEKYSMKNIMPSKKLTIILKYH
jgi:hypothetical protein